MSRIGVFHLIVAAVFSLSAASSDLAAQQQKSSDQDDNFDARSTVGDLHVGKDADAAKAGLPLSFSGPRN